VSPLAAAFAVVALGAVAAVGVAAGFLRRDPIPVEPMADPLEDRRLALRRSLSDLEEARASGALEEVEYERLREDTERRRTKVRLALDRREQVPVRARAAPTETAELEGRPSGAVEPRRVPVWAVAVLIGGTVAAMVVAALARDQQPQAATAMAPAVAGDDAFAFFEDRVRRHPDDLAARLDLAHRYLDAGRAEDALDQYAAALEIDPDDAEALAHVGMVLYLGERPEEALGSVDRALDTDPDYPEALFIRGVILLRGLDRPRAAIGAFERYLDAAPFGSERETVRTLIAEARGAIAADADGRGSGAPGLGA
jgi:tetratricopeptide (TPR) repeat protein